MLHFGCNYVNVDKKWKDAKGDIVYNDDVVDDYNVTSASGKKAKASKVKAKRFDDGESCLLDIMDTAGQEEFSGMRDHYLRLADGLLLVYDVTRPDTLQEAEQIFTWSLRTNNTAHIPAILCANKVDLSSDEHKISRAEGIKVAQRISAGFIETSAKTGQNVNEAFTELVRLIPRTGVDYKVIVLGSGGVGKSSVTIRFTQDTFVEQYDPTIEDSYRKMITVAGLKNTGKDSQRTGARPASAKESDSKAKLSTLSKIKRALSFKKKSSSRPQSGAPLEPGTSGSKQLRPSVKTRTTKVEWQKPTGNVFLITLGNLEQEKPLMTGEPIKCGECGSVLALVSDPCSSTAESTNPVSYEDGFAKWTCEFCGKTNQVEAEKQSEFEARLPSLPVVEYMLEPPQFRQEQSAQGMVVYCIDVSSSMSDSHNVPTSLAQWKSVKSGGTETKDRVTSMEGVKVAVCRQLERLQIEHPDKQVVIVTFASDVRVHGNDGVLSTISSCDLDNYDLLLQKGRSLYNDLNTPPVSSVYSQIYELVQSLRTSGCTALGPALAVSCAMVSTVPCSEVVLCTDGQPNRGVGNLQAGTAEFNSTFYAKIGSYAKANDTKISIIGLEGAEISMSRIEEAARITSGSINILHPIELIRQLRIISQNPVIATEVRIQAFAHPALLFPEKTFQNLRNCMEQKVGNATKSNDLSFEFEMNPSYKEVVPDSVPFQVQISYIKADGSRFLRVISTRRECTTDRDAVEKGVVVAVLSLASVQKAARLAQGGDFQAARNHLHATRNMIERGAETVKQKEEFFANLAESEALDDELRRNIESKSRRRGEMSDSTVNVLHSNLKSNLGSYLNAADKRELCQGRKTTAELSDQYYKYSY